jgi:hypothetical protein
VGNKKKAKKLTAANAELTKTLTGVRAQLTKTETKLGKANEKAERWQREATAARTAASRSDARVEKLQKKLDRASAALKPVHAVGPLEATATGRPAAEPTAGDGLTIPDQTWTVVQLRAEARARGVAGMSNKPKAQLLAALARDA